MYWLLFHEGGIYNIGIITAAADKCFNLVPEESVSFNEFAVR